MIGFAVEGLNGHSVRCLVRILLLRVRKTVERQASHADDGSGIGVPVT